MIPLPPHVHYRQGKQVSDVFLKLFMESITQLLGSSITVHSGNRSHRPTGSPARSLHLSGRAGDFHVAGMSDSQAFQFLWLNQARLPQSQVNRYQIIHHGLYTATEAEHIHIGHYQLIKALALGPGLTFLREGYSLDTRGHYSIYGGRV